MTILTKEKNFKIHNLIEPGFSADSSFDKKNYKGGSFGHCTIVSMFLYSYFGGQLVSTKSEGISHWYNRLALLDNSLVDVDLTGDQFGHEAVRIVPAEQLYKKSKIRKPIEINAETIDRYVAFIEKIQPVDILYKIADI